MNLNELQASGLDNSSSPFHEETPQVDGSFPFTQDQLQAINKLMEFLADPCSDWFFTFQGYAGTGKTTCMLEVVRRSRNSSTKFAYTAPTNKAAKVLRELIGEGVTIYSFLGLRVDKNGETKQITHGKPVDLSEVDVIVIDEASMINGHLFGLLNDVADKWNLKVVFMGDPAQLPPVKEVKSPALQGEAGVQLTKVMRHDNQILTLATAVRNAIWHPAPSITIKSDNANGEGVWKISKPEFRKAIFAAAERGEFADGRTSKIISWRNKVVDEYNQIARSAIYGAAAQPGAYLVGDRIVAAGPCERGDVVLMSTDDEAVVENVLECKHPLEPRYHALELAVRTEDNRLVRLLVCHPVSRQQFDNDCELLAHEARGNPRLWKRFWEMKEIFHDIRFAYALTAHRSQGSTYTNVYVDFQDILYNRNRVEAFQCLYVGVSRAKKCLYLA